MIFAILSNGNALTYILYIVFTLIAAYIAIVFHEVAHGLVAMWNGDYTAKNCGRISFNPLKHFDLIGFIMIMTVGFGYAKPVPINPYNFKHYKRGLITVSIAGVVMNLIIGFISALLYDLMIFGLYNTAGAAQTAFLYFADFFGILTTINLSLVFFNILPFYPLDGFRLIESLTKRGNKFCEFMRTNGRYILFGLVLLGFIIRTAGNYASLPYWFSYIDILGTYLNFFAGNLSWAFQAFWGLMIPGVM